MQTFLPYASFYKTARCLDYKRLGKQRVEAKQIYLALTKENYGWKNHPAVKMWRGYELSLLEYGDIICEEWKRRGYKDTLQEWFEDEYGKLYHERFLHYQNYVNLPLYNGDDDPLRLAIGTSPSWLGKRKFHDSHKSNLVRKNPEHYRKYFPRVKDNLPYYWPSNYKRYYVQKKKEIL